MKPLVELLRERAKFDFYRDGQLFYTTQSGFRFAVPISEVGTGTCLADDRAATFMKWIRASYAALHAHEKTAP